MDYKWNISPHCCANFNVVCLIWGLGFGLEIVLLYLINARAAFCPSLVTYAYKPGKMGNPTLQCLLDSFNIDVPHIWRYKKQYIHHLLFQKTAAQVSSSPTVDWGEIWAIHHHPDPLPGLQPNTDTHHISWPVRPNRIPCCSKENTEFRCTEEGIRGRAVRKERGSYLLFTLQWQQG